ncbi:unnamed protein product [Sphagnum tenellum]
MKQRNSNLAELLTRIHRRELTIDGRGREDRVKSTLMATGALAGNKNEISTNDSIFERRIGREDSSSGADYGRSHMGGVDRGREVYGAEDGRSIRLGTAGRALRGVLDKLQGDDMLPEEAEVAVLTAIGCSIDSWTRYESLQDITQIIYLCRGSIDTLKSELAEVSRKRVARLNPFLYYVWSLVEEIDGNDELSKELFQLSIESNPSNVTAMVEYASILERTNEHVKARFVYKEATRIPGQLHAYRDWSRWNRSLEIE